MNYGQEKQRTYVNETRIRDREELVGATILGGADIKTEHRAIPQAINNLEKDLYALGELVNALNNRLKPVSRPECPEVATQEKQQSPDVPMVNVIAQADLMLRGQIRILGDILQRLEV